MFTNKNEVMKKEETKDAVNMIGAGTVITGDIYSKGDIRVDGTLKGSVITEGKVVVGKEGVIEGDVECSTATSPRYRHQKQPGSLIQLCLEWI